MSLKWARTTRGLRRTLLKPSNQQTRTREKGEVASTSPLTVWLNGNTSVQVPCHLLGGGTFPYTPTVGDMVCIDNVDGDLVILGAYQS